MWQVWWPTRNYLMIWCKPMQFPPYVSSIKLIAWFQTHVLQTANCQKKTVNLGQCSSLLHMSCNLIFVSYCVRLYPSWNSESAMTHTVFYPGQRVCIAPWPKLFHARGRKTHRHFMMQWGILCGYNCIHTKWCRYVCIVLPMSLSIYVSLYIYIIVMLIYEYASLKSYAIS